MITSNNNKKPRSQYLLSTLSVIGLLSLTGMAGSINSYADTAAGNGSAGFAIQAHGTCGAGAGGAGAGSAAGGAGAAGGGGGTNNSGSGSNGGTNAAGGGGGTGGAGAGSGSGLVSNHAGAGIDAHDVVTTAEIAAHGVIKNAVGTLRESVEPMMLSVYNTGPQGTVDTHGNVSVFYNDGQLTTLSQVFNGTKQQGFFKPGTAQEITTTANELFMSSDPMVTTNQDGTIDVFWLGADGQMWWTYQTGFDANTGAPTWCAPAVLWNTAINQQTITIPKTASTVVSNPLPVLGADIALAEASGTLPNVTKTGHDIIANACPGGGDANETVKVANICINATGGAVFANAEPGIEPASNPAITRVGGKVFGIYIGADWNLWAFSQTAVNAKDNPNAFTFPGVISNNGSWPSGHPNFVTNADGTEAVAFYRSFDRNTANGNVGSAWQVPLVKGAKATQVISTGSASQAVVSSNITGWFNKDGTVEIVWIGADGGVWHSWSTNKDIANLQWSAPFQLGETGNVATSDPVVAINPTNGWPQVFYRNDRGDIESIERVNWSTDAPQGQWAERTNLTEAQFFSAGGQHVASVVSPIGVVTEGNKCPQCLQLLYEGGEARIEGGGINNAAVDTNGGVTTVASKDNPNFAAHMVTANACPKGGDNAGNANTSTKAAPVETVADALQRFEETPHALWTLMQPIAGSNPDTTKPDAVTGGIYTGWTVPHPTGGITANPAIATTDACGALLGNVSTGGGNIGAFAANAITGGASSIDTGDQGAASGSTWSAGTGAANTGNTGGAASGGTAGTTASTLPANPVQPAGTGGDLPPGWAL